MSGKNKKSALVILPLLAAVVFATACGGGAEGAEDELDTLTLGFVPSVEAGTLTERAEPLAEVMEEELGVPVQADVLTNYIGLVEAMGNEQVDVGFLNSFGYVLARDRYPETEPLYKSVRFDSATYRGQFVVQSGSEYLNLEDLEGAEMAFVDPASTSGYLFPANQLVQEGLVEEGENPEDFFSEVTYAGSHDNALLALYNDEVDVAVSFEDAREELEEEFPDVMDQLEVLDYTEEIPNDTVSVRPGMSDETVTEVEEALLSASESEEGQEVLEDIYSIEGLEPAEDEEYDVIRDTAASLDLDLEEAVEEE